MTILYRIAADSISPSGDRLTSFIILYPRVLLAELYTHRLVYEEQGVVWEAQMVERQANRDISKNSASSRAIPLNRMIDKIMQDPYMPEWTGLQKGMQGSNLNDQEVIGKANQIWLAARDEAVDWATSLTELGIHKQDVNRLLEPWQHVTQIVTSSRWDNYFALRCHHKAFPPFRKLARCMYLLWRKNTPTPLGYGQWHLPLMPELGNKLFDWVPPALDGVKDAMEIPVPIRYSIARCAWISYENHEKDGSDAAVDRTFASLFSEAPYHASPMEHQACPMHPALRDVPHLRSNLVGWLQARKLVRGEVTTHYAPDEKEIAKWDDVPDELK